MSELPAVDLRELCMIKDCPNSWTVEIYAPSEGWFVFCRRHESEIAGKWLVPTTVTKRRSNE